MKIDKSKLYDSYITVDTYKQPYNLGDIVEYGAIEEQQLQKVCTDKTADIFYSNTTGAPCRRYYFTYNKDGKREFVSSQSFSNSLVTAMVRSGDFDIRDAILVVTDCCERCLSILEAKYLHAGNPLTISYDDYFFANWSRPCAFCEESDDKYFRYEKKSEEEKACHCDSCCGSCKETK